MFNAKLEEKLKKYDRPDTLYHGRQHIEKMLDIYGRKFSHEIELNKSNPKVTMSVITKCLPTAIVYHDIVYDDKIEKEERSSYEFIKDNMPDSDYTVEEIDYIIDAIAPGTVTHEFNDNIIRNLLICLDLYELGCGDKIVTHNWHLIYEETRRLNPNISLKEFSMGNLKFMMGLLERAENNIEMYKKMGNSDRRYLDNFDEVIYKIPEGIIKTMKLSIENL